MKHGLDTDGTSPATTGLVHRDITEKIIGAAFAVHRELGYGFLGKVYQKALQVELEQRGLRAVIEHRIKVHYKGVVVGEYQADLLVEDVVLVELKVAPRYDPANEAKLLNELKATAIKVGLLINFGRAKVEFERLVF
jgi:GxxExxY protein